MKVAILLVMAVLMVAPMALAEVFVTSDGTGTYVGGLKSSNPNGVYIGGTPTLSANGFYVDGTSKKKYRNQKWQRFKTAHVFKLTSSLKTHSK